MKRALIALAFAWPLAGVAQSASEPLGGPTEKGPVGRYMAISDITGATKSPLKTAILLDTATGRSWLLRVGKGARGVPTFSWVPIGFPTETSLPDGTQEYPR